MGYRRHWHRGRGRQLRRRRHADHRHRRDAVVAAATQKAHQIIRLLSATEILMKRRLSLSAILLATGACTTTAPVTSVEGAAPTLAAPAVDPAAEDARLLAFLDEAFEAQLARSPQGLTSLGRK